MTYCATALGEAMTRPEALVAYQRGGTSRKPVLVTANEMFAWTQRKTGRGLAGMYQSLDEASLVNATLLMQTRLQKST